MEAIARLRESVNGASPGAATSSSATRELAIDWFWALAAFVLGLAMFASGGLGPPSRISAGWTPWACCWRRGCRCRCWLAAAHRSSSSWS